jgi:hypothetical protein
MKNEDYLNTLYPPHWVAKILHLCISGALTQNDHGLKTELIYCVLPLLAVDEIRDKLTRANSRSSFFTMFEQNMANKREFTIDFSQRIRAFSGITNHGLIYLGNFQNIEINGYISTHLASKVQKTQDSYDTGFQKAAFYLGVLLAKEDPKNVFLKLGVMSL